MVPPELSRWMLEAPRVFSLFIGRLHDIFRPFLVDVEGFFSKKTFRCSFLLCSPQFSYCRFLYVSPSTFATQFSSSAHTGLRMHGCFRIDLGWNRELSLPLMVDRGAFFGSYFEEREMWFSCTERSSLLLLKLWCSVSLLSVVLFSCWFKVSMVRCCCFVMIPWIFECLWHWSGFLTS